jgi:hypothetical protein
LLGWALFGGATAFAIWELGGFAAHFADEPGRPAVARQMPAPFRPTGASGCTQASIDRATGQTTAGSCPAQAPSAEFLAARLTDTASPQ